MSLFLPRSQVTVCLKPGETLTEDEASELDEFFLMVAQSRAAEGDH